MVVLLAARVALAADLRPGEHDDTRERIAVVVGRSSFVTETSTDELRELYLRRQRLWPNGTRAIPINLPAENSVRQSFSQIVLGRSRDDLVAYWNGRYFEGITPPTVLPSASAVRGYLATEPAAIAYLPLNEVDSSVRVLLTLD
jgi:hypothetical protein